MKNETNSTLGQMEPEETSEAVENQTAQSGDPKEDPVPDTPKRPEIVVADSRGLNLRKGPHVSYDAITVLPDGTPVEILDLPEDVEVPNWALVKTWAGIGWVNTDFLRKVEP